MFNKKYNIIFLAMRMGCCFLLLTFVSSCNPSSSMDTTKKVEAQKDPRWENLENFTDYMVKRLTDDEGRNVHYKYSKYDEKEGNIYFDDIPENIKLNTNNMKIFKKRIKEINGEIGVVFGTYKHAKEKYNISPEYIIYANFNDGSKYMMDYESFNELTNFSNLPKEITDEKYKKAYGNMWAVSLKKVVN